MTRAGRAYNPRREPTTARSVCFTWSNPVTLYATLLAHLTKMNTRAVLSHTRNGDSHWELWSQLGEGHTTPRLFPVRLPYWVTDPRREPLGCYTGRSIIKARDFFRSDLSSTYDVVRIRSSRVTPGTRKIT
jgi:hypothetical protein